MRRLFSWRVPLRSLLRRRRVEREMAAELHFHFEQLVAEKIAAGCSPLQARREASLAFGGIEQVKEDCRDITVWRWIESVGQDIRYGCRNLRRSPGLVAVSVLSLGLGIGLNLALYSAVTTVFGHQPSMVDPDTIYGIGLGESAQVSYPALRDIQDQSIFAAVTGFRTTTMTLRMDDRRRYLYTVVATGNFFETLGAEVASGRPFAAVDAHPSGAALAVISHGFWTRTFGASPDAIGRVLLLDGEPVTIVGILPPGHRSIIGFAGPDLYVSAKQATLPAMEDRRAATLTALARLRPGATAAEAQAAATALAQGLARNYPEEHEDFNRPARLRPASTLQYANAGLQIGTVVLVMLFVLVLTIGCANVASMLLARTVSRRHELSIRTALGAGRGRVIQSVLVESALLTLLGAAAGVGLVAALVKFSPPGQFGEALQFVGIELDVRLLLFGLALATATALLCGAAPAYAATRTTALNGARFGNLQATPRLRLRNTLVTAQVAVSMLLLGTAALCLRSQLDILHVDVGFNLDGGVVARLDVDANRYSPAARRTLVASMVDRLEELPGIESAAVASFVPLGGESLATSFHPAGRSDIPGTRPSTFSVGPGYFRTLGIRLSKGRDFLVSDDWDRPAVAIVNETFARTYFADANPIGQRVQTGSEANAEIVGVVADSRIDTIGEAPKSVVYYPWAQRPRRLFMHAATTGEPAAIVSAIERALAGIDSTADISVTTRSEATSFEMTMRRTGTLLVGAIGSLGLMLTLIGLYGVVAYIVASRVVEFGIRMALGASPARLQREVLWSAGRLVAVGVAVGSIALLLLAQGLATFLIGLGARDVVPYTATTLVLLLVSLVASYIPARRVLRVDPVIALRNS